MTGTSLLRPMLATAGPLPGADVEHRWAFEMKWDGVRAVVYLDAAGGPTRVLTRNDREVQATYPELGGPAAVFAGRDIVLDGEVVAFDGAGRPSFGELQARMHVRAPSRTLLAKVPVSLLVFDLLRLDGELLVTRSYDERRELLLGLGLGTSADGCWAVPPAFEGDGAEALAVSAAQGLEGVVAKRRDSTYTPGRRSPSWIKVKHQRMQVVVVGGWSPGQGRRAGGIGSLLVGVPDESGALIYAGHVGTGFSAAALDDLAGRLRASTRATSPFDDEVPRLHARDAQWVTPRLVGEVVFAEWTRDGRLRHPSWRGLRPDKTLEDVRRES